MRSTLYRHRPIIVACGVALVTVSAAFSLGFPWGKPREGSSAEWLYFAHDLRATFCNPTPSDHVSHPYTLRLASTIMPASTDLGVPAHHACSAGPDSGVYVASTEGDAYPRRDWPRAVLWADPDVGASIGLDEGRVLCCFRGHHRSEPRLLCWAPDLGYEPVAATCDMSAEQLFVLNYAREARPSQRDCLLSALRAADRRESLHVRSCLESRAFDGTILERMRLDGTYHPSGSVVAELDRGTTGLVSFTSGYQVSEILYQELVHARLKPGESLWPAASDRVYGSFRGIQAVDLQEGEILWERRLGVIPRLAVVSDLDRDGLKEIVLSSYSPTNGISASGTTDLWCVYTICLDASGNEIWRYRFCGPYAGMAVAAGDVVGDERLEVIGTCGSASVEDAGCLVVLSPEGETIAEVTEWGGMKGLVLADLTGDGREEIVSGGACGKLLAFDGNLNVVASYTEPAHKGYESIRMRPLAANDLDGDGRLEIVALSFGWTMHDFRPIMTEGRVEEDSLSYLVILDERLKEQARILIPPVGGLRVVGTRDPGREMCLVADLDGDGRNEILLCGLGAAHVAYVFEVVAEDD